MTLLSGSGQPCVYYSHVPFPAAGIIPVFFTMASVFCDYRECAGNYMYARQNLVTINSYDHERIARQLEEHSE